MNPSENPLPQQAPVAPQLQPAAENTQQENIFIGTTADNSLHNMAIAEKQIQANVAPPPTSGVSIAAPVAPRVDGLPAASENIYTEIASQIIKEQEQIIGVLAIEQASHVEGLVIDPVTYHCTIIGSGSTVIDSLIDQYRDFFGHAAVEVCKEAASRFLSRLPAEQMPMSLR